MRLSGKLGSIHEFAKVKERGIFHAEGKPALVVISGRRNSLNIFKKIQKLLIMRFLDRLCLGLGDPGKLVA